MMSRQLLSVIQITHIFFMHRGMNRIMLLFKGRCWRRFYLCNLFLAFCFFFQGVNAEDTDTVTVHFQKNEFTIDEFHKIPNDDTVYIDKFTITAITVLGAKMEEVMDGAMIKSVKFSFHFFTYFIEIETKDTRNQSSSSCDGVSYWLE